MTDAEQKIRTELKIPDGASQVVILSMDAHMDWDWLLNFQNLVCEGNGSQMSANRIIRTAFDLMAGKHPGDTDSDGSAPYYYSICEMGFLRAAVETQPHLLDHFHEKIGDKLRIVGGGITSPDNVLPHGELFIRNYLLGKVWMKSVFGLPMRQAYIPDDFGHYSQLPTVLDAMGFEGVSFSRCPGSIRQKKTYPCDSASGRCSTYMDLTQKGHVDFVWQAADGSKVIAHFMQQHYSQGIHIGRGHSNENIRTYIRENSNAAPTPYLYVPCGDDFATPIEGLVGYASEWNGTQTFGTKDKPQGVYAVAATLDHYIQLIAAYASERPNREVLKPRSLHATPYWTGFYASRPKLKILSKDATRALLGAETFAFVADLLQVSPLTWWPAADARRSAIENGWEAAVPSTHHDYISGTAVDGVYTGEQIPLLENARCLGVGARESAQLEIANLILGSPAPDETPIAVFNQLGTDHSGLTELPPLPGVDAMSVRMANGEIGPVQRGENGVLLFSASAPCLGYQAAYLSPKSVTPDPVPKVSATGDKTRWVLENEHLRATISVAANWGIESLIDKKSKREMIPTSAIGNDLVFYIDDGSIYKFGNELGPGAMNVDAHGELEPMREATLVEDGPLRVVLRTVTEFKSKGGGNGEGISGRYIRDYVLLADEPLLRMSITGAAPLTAEGYPNMENSYPGNPYSVMVSFPFAAAGSVNAVKIDAMPHGSPFHYEDQMPEPYWASPIFQPTHNFVIPRADGGNLAAVFHASIPAWAVDANGALIGCVLRNTPPSQGRSGTDGSDTGTHTHAYAIRVPSGIGNLDTGALLVESLRFQTPLLAVYGNVPHGPMGNFKRGDELGVVATFSLAAVSGDAIITAAKRGTVDPSGLILRIYQPTNKQLDATLTFGPAKAGFSTIQKVTALEDPIDGEDPRTIANAQVKVSLERALTTFVVK